MWVGQKYALTGISVRHKDASTTVKPNRDPGTLSLRQTLLCCTADDLFSSEWLSVKTALSSRHQCVYWWCVIWRGAEASRNLA